MNICFYAPIKNEERYLSKFVKWHTEKMKEGDSFFFMVNNSTDRTIEILEELKSDNYPIEYWVENIDTKYFNFSENRNKILQKLVTNNTNYDILIALDIDEIFISSNWRDLLESVYTQNKDDPFSISFTRIEDCGEEKEGFSFIQHRTSICSNHKDFKWVYPVHECLTFTDKVKAKEIYLKELQTRHYRNAQTKRDYFSIISSYMNYYMESEEKYNELKEQYDNDISLLLHLQYIYANECFFHKDFDLALDEFQKFFLQLEQSYKLSAPAQMSIDLLKNMTRCYTRISSIFLNKKDYVRASIYATNAVGIYPCRETYLHLCKCYINLGNPAIAKHYFDLGVLFQNQESSYEVLSNCWNDQYLESLFVTIKSMFEKKQQM